MLHGYHETQCPQTTYGPRVIQDKCITYGLYTFCKDKIPHRYNKAQCHPTTTCGARINKDKWISCG